MVATCFTPIGGHTMRATKVDACGTVITGGSSCKVISNGFVRVTRTPEYEAGDEFTVKNANGDICVKERTADQLKWLTVEAEFCKVDPDLLNLMSASPLVLDDDTVPKSVGFRTREGVIPTVNFALEVWTRISGSSACAGGSVNYGYALWPWLVQGTITDYVFENGPISFKVNAKTKAGSLWGTGPYNVRNMVLTPFTAGKLLAAISATDHEHFQITNVAPPAVSACGCATVTVDP
jgi:hypothetical protein